MGMKRYIRLSARNKSLKKINIIKSINYDKRDFETLIILKVGYFFGTYIRKGDGNETFNQESRFS